MEGFGNIPKHLICPTNNKIYPSCFINWFHIIKYPNDRLRLIGFRSETYPHIHLFFASLMPFNAQFNAKSNSFGQIILLSLLKNWSQIMKSIVAVIFAHLVYIRK